jgi:hypothetical protein
MTIKLGTFTGKILTSDEANTVDISANVSYSDGSSESSLSIYDNVMRVTYNRAKTLINPLNATSSPLMSAPDTTFATGDIRFRVTRFT